MEKLIDEAHYFVPAYPEPWTCSQCGRDVLHALHLSQKIEKIDPAILDGGFQTTIDAAGNVTHVPLKLIAPEG